jgi:hypothetical protein
VILGLERGDQRGIHQAGFLVADQVSTMVGLLILLLLDPGQHLAETLVLDDGRVADALQLVEGGVRQDLGFDRKGLRTTTSRIRKKMNIMLRLSKNRVIVLDRR